MQKLEERFPEWSDLCNHVFSKISDKLPENHHKKFKSWFMKREQIGYRFDYRMILRCYKIWVDLNDNLDHFVVISGREGAGKSTFSFQIASWIIPWFTENNIVYTAAEYLKKLDKKSKKFLKSMEDGSAMPRVDSLIMDEGTELLSTETQKITNRILSKSFFVQRALRFLVIINIPNFFFLDSVVRNHRVKTLIDVNSRGLYTCYTGKAIKLIAKYGMKDKNISGVTVPNGTFFQGRFRKDFPLNLDYDMYNKAKIDGIDKLLSQMREDISQIKFFPVAKVAKEMSMSNEKLINMIKSEKIKGKQIGGKWYITKKAYDRLTAIE